jgi:nucleotide-binding universal stress UspA family protein
MYQNILVPVDGSPTSQRGLTEAIALARLTGGRLRLLHVVDELSFALSAGYGVTYSGDILNVLRETGGQILATAVATAKAAGLEVDSVLKDSMAGRVCDHVVDQATAWPADLIVLGTHGRRGVGRLFMGSDAEAVVRSAPVPVLLLRAAK